MAFNPNIYYQVTGSGTNITTVWTTMDITVENISNGNFSLATNQITVDLTGTYFISYNVNVLQDSTAGSTRGSLRAKMRIGTTDIAESVAYGYARETVAWTGVSAAFLVELTSGDDLDLQVRMSPAVDTSIDNIQISIIKML